VWTAVAAVGFPEQIAGSAFSTRILDPRDPGGRELSRRFLGERTVVAAA
jgi:hypothetical protein